MRRLVIHTTMRTTLGVAVEIQDGHMATALQGLGWPRLSTAAPHGPLSFRAYPTEAQWHSGGLSTSFTELITPAIFLSKQSNSNSGTTGNRNSSEEPR